MKSAKKVVSSSIREFGHFFPESVPKNTFFLSDETAQIFFGYYDVSPFSSDGRSVLAMRAAIGNISPHNVDVPLDVGFYDLSVSKPIFHAVGKSHSWNWQQGCRLQWLGDTKDKIIYNNFVDGHFCAHVKSLTNHQFSEKYDCPVYAVSANAEYGLTLDFVKLHRNRRGYGYHNKPDKPYMSSDIAVARVCLLRNEIIPLLTYAQVAEAASCGVADAGYINHLSLSPDNNHFIFFYILMEGGKRRTHLMYCDSDGGHLLNLIPGYTASHYAWKADGMLLVTALSPQGKMEYLEICPNTGEWTQVFHPLLLQDGHPTYISNDVFVSDTYPSRLGMQSVFTYNKANSTYTRRAFFYLPRSFAGELRCDLHPRLSKNLDMVCVDVVRNGRRAMAVMPLGGLEC